MEFKNRDAFEAKSFKHGVVIRKWDASVYDFSATLSEDKVQHLVHGSGWMKWSQGESHWRNRCWGEC